MGTINNKLYYFNNQMKNVAKYPNCRIDTHFYSYMDTAQAFLNKDFKWTKLEYIIDEMSNGENLDTKWYCIDEDSTVQYLSVSQITEFGLQNKNVHFLKDDLLEHEFGRGKKKRYVKKLDKDTIIVTRSGTPGIAINTNHPSFDDVYTYIPSGFVIYFTLKNELHIQNKRVYNIDPKVITFYLNLKPIRHYLIANSSGRCQRNISQSILRDLPIPEQLLTEENQKKIIKIYDKIETASTERTACILRIQESVNGLWDKSWDDFIELLS